MKRKKILLFLSFVIFLGTSLWLGHFLLASYQINKTIDANIRVESVNKEIVSYVGIGDSNLNKIASVSLGNLIVKVPFAGKLIREDISNLSFRNDKSVIWLEIHEHSLFVDEFSGGFEQFNDHNLMRHICDYLSLKYIANKNTCAPNLLMHKRILETQTDSISLFSSLWDKQAHGIILLMKSVSLDSGKVHEFEVGNIHGFIDKLGDDSYDIQLFDGQDKSYSLSLIHVTETEKDFIVKNLATN